MDFQRLVVVSNRLPIVVNRDESGKWAVSPGSGGLVTALNPVLRNRGGTWIGWLGTGADESVETDFLQDVLATGAEKTGYNLRTVDLTEEEVRMYYYGFSNEILWPLFHDLPSRCNFDSKYWEFYVEVNQRFADQVRELTTEQDYVWVHDYQLIPLADRLKKTGASRRTGFFLHIPFPPLDIFLKLPWRFEILEAMLQYDLIGFQTIRDRQNFFGCIRAFVKGAKVLGRGYVTKLVTVNRELQVGTFPISIDFKEFAELASTREVADQAWIIHSNLPNRQLILGVDRLDYTKGIPHRLQAFSNALERYPELRTQVSLVQVVVPSREGIEEYDLLKQEIERLVGEINGRFTEVGWIPIIYMYRSLDRVNLEAYYRTCEIALITPLKDGMNLVAKEYCASSIDEGGVLVLSEFAGAAPQLHNDALLVNPYDVEGVADAIYRAFTMKPEERQARMKSMRRLIARQDVFQWVNSFLKAATASVLSDLRQVDVFVPERRSRGKESSR